MLEALRGLKGVKRLDTAYQREMHTVVVGALIHSRLRSHVSLTQGSFTQNPPAAHLLEGRERQGAIVKQPLSTLTWAEITSGRQIPHLRAPLCCRLYTGRKTNVHQRHSVKRKVHSFLAHV